MATASRTAKTGPCEHGVVITVPGAFEAREQVATVEAGRRVGFTSVGLLSEPVATALAYGSSHRPRDFGRLIGSCCAAKEALATSEQVFVDIAEVDPSSPLGALSVTIDCAERVAITSDFVRRTFSLCDLVLDETRITTRDIDAAFLAGGSTRLPGLGDMVGTDFGKRARFDLDPIHVVAIGASLAALRPDLSPLLASQLA